MKRSLSSNPSQTLSADLRAGFTVFLVALPLCLGIASASNVPLMSGVIAGVIGGIVIGALGGSQVGVSGPAAGLVTVILGALASLGNFEGVLLATALAGGIQVVLGLARLGNIAYFFPSSVIKGMMAAIGIIILLKQLPHGLGYDRVPEGSLEFVQEDGHTTLSELGYMFSTIEPAALFITVIGLLTIVLWDRPALKKMAFFRIVPGGLAVVLIGILIEFFLRKTSSGFALSPEHLVQIESGNMAAWFIFPDFDRIGDSKVWVVALVIAGIASVESLLSAEATDKMDPDKRITPMNRELMAQGLGNMISGLVGGLPVTQVVVRSSANVQSGGKTRLATVIHGILLAVAVILLPAVINLIPMSALAAILIIVGYKLAQPALFILMWRKGIAQFIPFVVTVVAILFTDLLIGIGIGMGVGILAVLYSNFKSPFSFEMSEGPNGSKRVRMVLAEVVTFLNKGQILNTLRLIPDGSEVTIDARRCLTMDYDVKGFIEDFEESAAHRGIRFTYLPLDKATTAAFPRQREVERQLTHKPVPSHIAKTVSRHS